MIWLCQRLLSTCRGCEAVSIAVSTKQNMAVGRRQYTHSGGHGDEKRTREVRGKRRTRFSALAPVGLRDVYTESYPATR